MWTTAFWKGTGERAIKTFFQSFVGVVTVAVGAEAIGATAGIADVSWLDAASVALVATILSVATSIGNADFTAGYDEPVKDKVDGESIKRAMLRD